MVEKLPFGASFLYRLTDGGCTAEIIPYGAALRRLTVPDRDGNPVDVVLGYDSLEEYESQDACLGAIVGRYANRIAGAGFVLNGVSYPLFANEGKNTLHGGQCGFHNKMWNLCPGEDGQSLICTLHSPHMDEGFPGNLDVKVTYVLKNSTLSIHYEAKSDADTPLNLTNHSYFNLSGQGNGPITDHILTLQALQWTPAGTDNIPLGYLKDTSGTPWDLLSPTPLGPRLAHPDLAPTRGFDQNFVLNLSHNGPKAVAFSQKTGICMEMDTDREGVQLYTAGWLSHRKGKDGTFYDESAGFCLETQHFPNAINQENFPSPVLRAGETFRSTTTFRFSVK